MRASRLFFKFVAAFLIMGMLISDFAMGTQIGNIAYGNTATASEVTDVPFFSDTKGHWAEKQINEWGAKSWTQGFSDGTFKPESTVSRGEFMAFINRSFGFEEKAAIHFSDVNASSWVHDEIAKAVQAGYIKGYVDGTFRADRPISRQEVAVIVSRLLKLDETANRQATENFSDATQIARWSQGAIGALAVSGLMVGYGNQGFKPEGLMTRAEVVVTLNRTIAVRYTVTYKQAGTYGPSAGRENVERDVVVIAPGVTLRNMKITGNVILAEGIGEGDVFLDNVEIEGVTTLKNGRGSSHFNNSALATVIIEGEDGNARVVVKGKSMIAKLNILSTSTIELLQGAVGELTISKQASGVSLDIGEGVTVTTLNLEALAKIIGKGIIKLAVISEQARETTFDRQPERKEGSGSISKPTTGGGNNSVTPEPTPEPTPTPEIQYDIVKDGVAKAVIVIPSEPNTVENYAAGELQYHIKEATNVTLQISKESETLPEGTLPIYLGRTASALAAGIDAGTFEPRSYVIRTTPQGVYISGRDESGSFAYEDEPQGAGTLLGVYEILRNDLKVKWLWPGKLGEDIPHTASFSLGQYDVKNEPQLKHVRWRETNFAMSDISGVSQATKAKFIEDQLIWLRRHGFSQGISLEYGHAFEDYWDRFKNSNPEYFNLLEDGTRRPGHPFYPGTGSLISMNVGNEGFQDRVIEEWLVNRTAKRPYVNGAENDTPGMDRSPESLALDNTTNPYPIPAGKEDVYLPYYLSDRYAKFWLSLLEKARVHNPEVKVIGYAYENYSAPPVDTQLNEDIVIAIVPEYIFPWSEQNRQKFKEQWNGWFNKGASLFLRPNYTLSGHNMPIQYAEAFGEDFNYAYDRGMMATDFDSLTGMYGTQGPTLYTIARLNEEPGKDVDTILNEYYDAYGPAKSKIEEYFGKWNEVTLRAETTFQTLDLSQEHVISIYADFNQIIDSLFTANDFIEAQNVLDDAKILVSESDSKYLQRIEFLEKGLTDAKLTWELITKYKAFKLDPSKETEMVHALQAVDSYRKSIAVSGVSNIWFSSWAENRTVNRKLYQQLDNYNLIESLPKTWSFKWDPLEVGDAEQWYSESSSTTWDSIAIDNVWQEQPIGMQWKNDHGTDYTGVAWYKTTFEAGVEPLNNLALLFGAVDKSSKIWINGQAAGENIYDPVTNPNAWEDPFQINLANYIRPGTNTVVVKVESRFGVGGIYKPVWFVRKNTSDPISLADGAVAPEPAQVTYPSWVEKNSYDDFDFDAYILHDSEATGIELILDQGTSLEVQALQLANRGDTATNLNIADMKIMVGSSDDGIQFDQEIFNGTVPGGISAGEVRQAIVDKVKKRYFKVIVTSNFLGPITSEIVDRDRIHTGPFRLVRESPVSPVQPTIKSVFDGFVMYSNPDASSSGTIELAIDLGQVENVAELQIKNRPIPTLLSVAAVSVWVGSQDDGEHFDQEIYNGGIPGTINANEVRSITITPSTKRYFKIKITDNFLGPINGSVDQDAVQFTELRYTKKLD